MIKVRHPIYKYIFLGVDIFCFTLAFIYSLHVTVADFWGSFKENYYYGISHLTFFFIILIIYLFSFRYNTLYLRNILITRYRQLVLIIKSLLVGMVVTIILMAIFNVHYLASYGKIQIMYLTLVSLILLFVFRVGLSKMILKFLFRKEIYPQRVLIIGGDAAGRKAADSLMNDAFVKFNIIGFLDDYKEKGESIRAGFENLGNLEDLNRIAKEHAVNEILIAIDNVPYTRLAYIVEKCLETARPVRIYSDLLDVVSEKMKVEYYSETPVVELFQYPLTGKSWKDKRTLDIMISLGALIFLSPIFLAIFVGIKASSKGPIIFKQTRIGKHGRPFSFYKFRSMHMGEDNSKHKEFVEDFIQNKGDAHGKNIKVFKITDDPRVFRFGRFLRKTSLDEFPQLVNVLKGEMALVGPRPCLPYEWECYDEWHKERLNVLPGCTGLWQTLGRSSVTFEEMVILDLYYISNMSLWFDFKIVLQTFPVIFFGKGAY